MPAHSADDKTVRTASTNTNVGADPRDLAFAAFAHHVELVAARLRAAHDDPRSLDAAELAARLDDARRTAYDLLTSHTPPPAP